MSDDDDGPGPPLGADIVDLGECEEGGGKHHLAAFKDGRLVGVGHATQLRDGVPLNDGDVVVHTKEGKVVSKTSLAAGNGPAQVATKTYRSNYDRIFGEPKPEPDRSLN